jgi:hypothetical protein
MIIPYLFLVSVVLLIFILVFSEKFTEKIFGISSTKIKLGENSYNVSDDFENKENSAKLQKSILNDIDKVMKSLDEKFNSESMSNIHGNTVNHKSMINNFKRRWSKNNFYEGTPNSKDSSFTIGKGDYFVICMRNKQGVFHDRITLLFVVLHEVAHIMNNNYGHGRDFWSIFKWLLGEAENILGVKFPNYEETPVQYCNTKIYSNPLFE